MNILVGDMSKTNPLAFPQNLNEIQRETEELQRNFSRSITFGEYFAEMMERLFEARQEHAINNWDGYGAKAIDEQSYQNAIRFILTLTPDIPAPEIGVEPDGEVVFEWYGGKRKVFSISMGSRNELTYAGLYGVSKTYGVEHFYGNIPDTLLDNISRVFPKGV